MTRRREDWPTALAEAYRRAGGRAFEWGRLDCCLFAADLIAAMTGADPAEGLRGRYDDVKGARRLLLRHGGSLETLADGLAARHGWPESAPKLARRGDLALVELPLTIERIGDWAEALGIVLGARVAVMGPAGPVQIQLACARRCWRID